MSEDKKLKGFNVSVEKLMIVDLYIEAENEEEAREKIEEMGVYELGECISNCPEEMVDDGRIDIVYIEED
tara:strand:- start:6696 stop:6905 length:210 start_codon:yes stop_codon:yes gene_type:complete